MVIDPGRWLTCLFSLTRGVRCRRRRSLVLALPRARARVCVCVCVVGALARVSYGYWLRLIRRRTSSSSVTRLLSLCVPCRRNLRPADSRPPTRDASASRCAVLFTLADNQAAIQIDALTSLSLCDSIEWWSLGPRRHSILLPWSLG